MRLTRATWCWAIVMVAATTLGFVVAQQQSPASNPITAVELKSEGFWPGSLWHITFRENLSAERSEYVESQARAYTGTIAPADWKHLVSFVEKSGCEQLERVLSKPPGDDASSLVVTLSRGSASKSVECADAGPTEFWAVQMVLRGMAETVSWKPTAGGSDK